MAEQAQHILVIDDEQGIRLSMQMFLEDAGFRVTTAKSGKEALELIQDDFHNMAIVDMRLGDCTGIELIPQLLEHNPRIEVLIMTGSLNINITPELKAQGMTSDDVITKPVCDLSSLESIIRQKLDTEREA